jgi:hypothetical protein
MSRPAVLRLFARLERRPQFAAVLRELHAQEAGIACVVGKSAKRLLSAAQIPGLQPLRQLLKLGSLLLVRGFAGCTLDSVCCWEGSLITDISRLHCLQTLSRLASRVPEPFAARHQIRTADSM